MTIFIGVLFLVFQEVFHLLILSLYHSKLHSLYKRFKQQMEQHLTLRCLDSSILTFSEGRIKYFNDRGKSILHTIASSLDASEQRACDRELECLHEAIHSQNLRKPKRFGEKL